MHRSHALGHILLKLGSLALFGFLAITFAAPILALASVVLFFALIGFLLWLPLHTLIFGRNATWRPNLDRGKAFARRAAGVLGSICHASLAMAREAQETVRGTASFLGVVLVETFSGALVGVLLMVTLHEPNAVTPPTVALAAAIGAGVGLLVVLSRRKALREPLAE